MHPIQIDHKKTPEKIIFFAADREPEIPAPIPYDDTDIEAEIKPQMKNPFAAFGGMPFGGGMPTDMGQMATDLKSSGPPPP